MENKEEIIEEQNIFSKTYPITQAPNPSGGLSYDIFIFDEIYHVSYFAEIISILSSAQEYDTVTFKINSNGGALNSLIALMFGLDNTQAITTAECSGEIASAATVFALRCDNLVIADYSTFMIHNYSGGMYGKGHELEAEATHSIPYRKEFIRDVYEGFLTKKEIKRVINGGDKYLTAQEVRERWDKMISLRAEKQQEAQEAYQVEQDAIMINHLKSRGYSVE